jgi:hypothetical protein
MKDWYIGLNIPPINLGESGENNAITISIKVDNIIEAEDVKYYLDICDKIDGETPISVSQQMNIVEEIVDDEETGEEITIYYLQMKPLAEWLGKSNVKMLQVRCEYSITTEDEETHEETITNYVLKSNHFYGYVSKGIYFS